MLKYDLVPLSVKATAALKQKQDDVDAESDHKARYKKASTLFAGKNSLAAFEEVRRLLEASSPNGKACYYCERDRFRDIEHVQPKRHYPERAFDWLNYVYACVVCNQDQKRDTYAVFTGETDFVEFDRSWPIDDPVPTGDPVLIDPRTEDPLEFLQLDLETGSLVSFGGTGRSKIRGNYTRDLFELDAPELIRTRRNHVQFYLIYCKRYLDAVADGDAARAALALQEILNLEHPTVIVELRRQSSLMPALRQLFDQLPPEVGSWPKAPAKT